MKAELPIAAVRNRRLLYNFGSPESSSAAASSSLQTLPEARASHAGFSIADADGTESFSIATFSYALVRNDMRDVGVVGWYVI